MKAIRTILFLIFIPCFLLMSCSDDDKNGGNDITPVKKQVVEINFENFKSHIYTFIYDKNNRLQEFRDTETFRLTRPTCVGRFEYDESGRLKSYDWMIPYKPDAYDNTVFFYKEDTVFAIRYLKDFAEDYSQIWRDTILLDNKGLITKLLPYDNQGEIVCSYDEKDNLTEYKIHSSIYDYGIYGGEVYYKYGDAKNLLANQGVPQWFWFYRNRYYYEWALFSITTTGANSPIQSRTDNSSNFLLEYITDADGYPTGIITYGQKYESIIKYRTIDTVKNPPAE